MKFSCTREKLAAAIYSAERFTGKNITLPILGNILIEFLSDAIRLTATNLEHAIQVVVKGVGNEGGSVVIPSKILGSLLQSLKDDQVEIEANDGVVFLKTTTLETKIHGVSAQDFPLIPKVKKNYEFHVSAKDLVGGIRNVLPAVSQSEFKPELAGVLWRVAPASLRFAATDTFRLAEKTVLLPPQVIPSSFSFILPAKSASEISRVFDTDSGSDVRVVVDDNQVMFESGGISIISRLIEGKFPEYDAVIPKNHETTCRISRQEIQDAVRGSGIFVSKLQDVSIRLQGKTIEVTSVNNEVGEYKTKTSAEIQGKNIQINFNYRYILDGLNMLYEDEIFLGCNTEQSPVLFRNINDGTMIYIVMPIRAT